MAFFQLLLKAEKLEKARLRYEDEKLRSIEISKGAKPRLTLRQRLRRKRLKCACQYVTPDSKVLDRCSSFIETLTHLSYCPLDFQVTIRECLCQNSGSFSDSSWRTNFVLYSSELFLSFPFSFFTIDQ